MGRTHWISYSKFSFDAYAIPTEEDRLDINFRSIVSDLNAIMGGTLGPRSWSDIATTWKSYESHPKVRAKDRSLEYNEKKKAASKLNTRIKHMVSLLIDHGMEPKQAAKTACKLLVTKKEKTDE